MTKRDTRSTANTEQRARFEALPPDRQAGLLDPAQDEFAEHGYDQASLNLILERAGLSKGQAYYYVKDKAQLYLLVIERAFERIVAAIGPLRSADADPESYWNAIGQLFKRVAIVLSRDAPLARLARAIYPTSVAANAALEPLLARMHDRLTDHVRLGQSIGAVRDDLPADFLAAGALGFAARVDRWFALHGQNLNVDDAGRLNDAAVHMCRAMLAPPAGGVTRKRSARPSHPRRKGKNS